MVTIVLLIILLLLYPDTDTLAVSSAATESSVLWEYGIPRLGFHTIPCTPPEKRGTVREVKKYYKAARPGI